MRMVCDISNTLEVNPGQICNIYKQDVEPKAIIAYTENRLSSGGGDQSSRKTVQ